MLQKKISTFLDFVSLIERIIPKRENVTLYRGQCNLDDLIPAISKSYPNSDTLALERKMFDELLRRCKIMFSTQNFDNWDWLVYAQHFGMKTRLLDWSSNPLVALWFACNNYSNLEGDAYVYIFAAADYYLVDKQKIKSPFDIDKTFVLKANINNERIQAQSGWFTVHTYLNEDNCFLDLRKNPRLSKRLIEITIPSILKNEIIEKLNIFGINSQTLFPDISGLCKQINWELIDNKINAAVNIVLPNSGAGHRNNQQR